MLQEKTEKKEDDGKAEQGKDRRALERLLDELDKSAKRIKELCDQKLINKLLEELARYTERENIFFISQILEKELDKIKYHLLTDVDRDRLAKTIECRQEIFKELISHQPQIFLMSGANAAQGEKASLMSLNSVDLYLLRNYVGGLLTKDAVRQDEELKLQVINLYYRLDYLSKASEKSNEQSLARKKPLSLAA